MKKYTKDRLFEMMSKVDNKFQINEYDNFNYPAGADANPNAPWNQSSDETNGIEVNFDKRYPYTFTIDLHSSNGGYASFDGYDLVERSKNPEIKQYFDSFENGLSFEIVNSPEFVSMAKKLFDEVVNEHEIEWEYDESIDEVLDNGEDMSKIQTQQLPLKLYNGNHLTSTAKYLSQNMAYIHFFDAEKDDEILCYAKPFGDAIVYEFDVPKMIKLGFSINKGDNRVMGDAWIVVPPKDISYKNTIRFIDRYMSKVIIDMEEFSLINDINDKLGFIGKFGMPTIPLEIKNNDQTVTSSKLPSYGLNEKKV